MRLKSFPALAFTLLLCAPLRAHNMPQSAVHLDFHRDGVAVELTLPLNELELSFKQPLMPAPDEIIARHGPALKEYVAGHVQPVSPDGKAWSVEVREMSVKAGQPNVEYSVPDLAVHLWMRPPAGAPLRQFTLNYSVICHEVMSHIALVSVRNDWNNATFSHQPQLLGAIQFTVTSVNVDRTSGSVWQGFRSVLRLGIEHIADGTDHLLFLLVLLLPAPLVAAGKKWGAFGGLRRSLVQLFKIVSAFTIGHSLTLIVGAAGWLRLPSQPVEILIAVSILVSAIHAARPIFAGREMWIASGLGLIHGLAFAGIIAEYGFSPWHMAMSILGFNLGIELMQLVVVAVTIPWLILLSRTRGYTPVRIAGAVFAAIASLCWIGERAFSWSNPFDPVVNALTAHPLWIVAMLAVFALVATFWPRGRGVPPVASRS